MTAWEYPHCDGRDFSLVQNNHCFFPVPTIIGSLSVLIAPLLPYLEDAGSVLIAGAGGGYDILGAVPLLVGLRQQGLDVHLASLSFTVLRDLPGAESEADSTDLYRVTSDAASKSIYCPEAWLAQWLTLTGLSTPEVWCFRKTGVQPLRRAYDYLIDQLEIDTVILVDGGIDGILRGDEFSLGTPGEDLASLAAIQGLEGVTTFMAAVGFGAELRDGIAHAQALRAVSRLAASGGYLGSASLLPHTEGGRAYLAAHDFLKEHQKGVRGSHIHAVIRCAMEGTFGYQGPHTWVSTLSSLYWYFSLPIVAQNHLFLEAIENTTTLWEVNSMIEGVRKTMEILDRESIPL